MSDNLNAEIAQWLNKAAGPTAQMKVDTIDHGAYAAKHDAASAKYSAIADAMGSAAMGNDSRANSFYANAHKASQHASDLHAMAADAHRMGSMDEALEATKNANDASDTADAVNDAAGKIAEAQAKGNDIVALAEAGNNNPTADANAQLYKDMGYMMGDEDDSSSSSDDSSSSSSSSSSDSTSSSDLDDLVIAAEKSADAGENYRMQSVQAYMNNDHDMASQLAMLAVDAYKTAHAYLRQAALKAGMNGGIAKHGGMSLEDVVEPSHPLYELVISGGNIGMNNDMDGDMGDMDDNSYVLDPSHPLYDLANGQ
jgi:hypothetical protein